MRVVKLVNKEMKPLGMESMKRNGNIELTFYVQQIRSTKLGSIIMLTKRWNEEIRKTKLKMIKEHPDIQYIRKQEEKNQFSENISKDELKLR
jgi:hypothetical protein